MAKGAEPLVMFYSIVKHGFLKIAILLKLYMANCSGNKQTIKSDLFYELKQGAPHNGS